MVSEKNSFPAIERIAEIVHENWRKAKTAKGIASRKSADGEELMVPYKQLSEKAKDSNRQSVKTVYDAIEKCDGDIRNLPPIEKVSAAVHDSWMAGKREKGITSRLAEDGEELMVPYKKLSEAQKDQDRYIVKTVYEALGG